MAKTSERDGSRVGVSLLRLEDSPLKQHLLLKSERLTKWADVRAEVINARRAQMIANAIAQPMDTGAIGFRRPCRLMALAALSWDLDRCLASQDDTRRCLRRLFQEVAAEKRSVLIAAPFCCQHDSHNFIEILFTILHVCDRNRLL